MISFSVASTAKCSVVQHLLLSFFWKGSQNESMYAGVRLLTDVKTIKQIYYRQHSGIELPLVFFLHTTYTANYTVCTNGHIKLFRNPINSCHNK